MPGADCDSDHNPVVVKMKIRLQRVKKAKKTVKWNVNNLKKSEVRNAYRMRLDQQLQEEIIDGCMEVDEIWKRLKDSISTVAEEVCGKEMRPKKQRWMMSLKWVKWKTRYIRSVAGGLELWSEGEACGGGSVSAGLLRCMGERGVRMMTGLIGKIYKSGYIPEDFRESIFVPISKVSEAQECGDFRTIALISHASKVLLHLIKRRITPIIERQLGDSQMGFRKGKGTRDAIFQLRMISERITQMNREKEIKGKMKMKMKRKKIYLCFVDYQKAFDRVRHDKLAEVMVKAGVPDLERRLIINLYWRQHAAVRWDGEVSREVGVERGLRQGCVISPMLFNLYSEFMIQEAMEGVERIGFGGVNITNLRYADDAVLVAEKRKKCRR